MKQDKEIQVVNPFDYIYEEDQVTMINGNALLSFMAYLEQVIATQPKIGALLQYPEKVEKITDENGELLKVDIEWADHNKNSFFFTAVDNGGSVPIMTDISLKGHQLLFGLYQIHQENINKGIAKLQTDKDAETVFRA